jgi:hypothetical protein
MKPRTLIALALLAGAASATWACGTCAEDKMAATYDYATTQRATAAGKLVVYCEIAGGYDADRLHAAARRVRGVDARTVRISADPAAVSFVLDAKQQSPQAAALSLQTAAAAGMRLNIIRIVGPGH